MGDSCAGVFAAAATAPWQRFDQRSRRRSRLVGVADQLEQVMIFHVLDLVGEPDEAAIDVVEFAPVELVAELFAAQAERVASGMLAQHQSANRARPPIAAS